MSDPADDDARALAGVQTALRLVCVSLPHLAGLAYVVRAQVDPRIDTIGVFPSGRIVVNPAWFNALDRSEATFAVAHELLHLALATHERAAGANGELFNQAHDYIINDILSEALGRPPPAQGLELPGARHLSAEQIMDHLRRSGRSGNTPRSWASASGESASPLATALRAAGLAPERPPEGSDVLPETLERTWFPDADPRAEARSRRRVREAANTAVDVDRLRRAVDALTGIPGDEPGDEAAMIRALRSRYRPPWELALQQWLEAVAPGPRTYARPSRRAGDRTDVVLPGHRRAGWTLHIVLDTSGSMGDEFPRVLGAIAAFCEGVGVGLVHILQCDEQVTQDDLVEPEALYDFRIAGYGGSDMSPAMARLAQDPEVEAALVLTDGAIAYPPQPMPYAVLWVLTHGNEYFKPPYGRVIALA